jgi:predicted dinucleotide-utilizing enzyme
MMSASQAVQTIAHTDRNPRRMRTVAIAGLGAVGQTVLRALNHGIPGLELAAVSARNRERAEKIDSGLNSPDPVLDLEQ